MRAEERSHIPTGSPGLSDVREVGGGEKPPAVSTPIDPTNAAQAKALIGGTRSPSSGTSPPNQASFFSRAASFIGRHKGATAGALLPADLVLNIFSASPRPMAA